MVNLIPGCYEAVMAQEAETFWVKCGMPVEMAKGFAGTKVKLELKCIGTKTLYGKSEIVEMPELTNSWIVTEGTQTEVPMHEPFGKVKVRIKFTGDNKFELSEALGRFGTVHCKRTFGADGSEWVYTSKEYACSYTQHWNRHFDLDGTFRLIGKCEGDIDIEDFIDGFSTETVENPNFKYQIVVTDDGFVSTDHIEGSTYKTDAKFGIAASNAFDRNLTDLHKKSGPREIKSVQTHASGKVTEIYTTWAPDLKTQTTLMKDVQSGKFVKFTMENFVDFSGTFKVASIIGLEQYCGVLGKNVDRAKAFYAHPSTKLVFEERRDFCEKSIYHKGGVVQKMGFHYNEEVSLVQDNRTWRAVVTKEGCKMIRISKCDTFTRKAVLTKTKNFLIMEDEICGTGVTATFIYVSC